MNSRDVWCYRTTTHLLIMWSTEQCIMWCTHQHIRSRVTLIQFTDNSLCHHDNMYIMSHEDHMITLSIILLMCPRPHPTSSATGNVLRDIQKIMWSHGIYRSYNIIKRVNSLQYVTKAPQGDLLSRWEFHGRAPGFLELLLSVNVCMHVCVFACVCVSAPEAMNN